MIITYVDYILICLSWGHFYFAYSYFIKRAGWISFLHYFIIALLLSFSLFAQLQTFPKLYIFVVILMFLIHNTIDLFRFKKDNQAIFFFSSGLVFLSTYTIYNNSVSGLLVKLLVIYHYVFWYVFYKFDSKVKKYLFYKQVIIVHFILFISIILAYIFKFQNLTLILFSTNTFYFMTLHHVIFSYISRYKNVFSRKH